MRPILHRNDTIKSDLTNHGGGEADFAIAPDKEILNNRRCDGLVDVKDSQAVFAVGMPHVTAEFKNRNVDGMHVGRVDGSASGRDFRAKPNAVSAGGNGMIANNDVGARHDPETCWCLIRIQQVHRGNGLDGEIVFQSIKLLWPILNKESMPHNLVRKVVFEPQIVNAVDGHSAIPRMMHRDVALERLAQVPDHVPMDGVSAEPKGLPCISDFEVAELHNKALVTG
mmetsp:Transcript_38242/g.56154  ORF Transcript_38242/g.56154 Transcript_38242/m.56154 type:complete len:226 (-) Transcript_38242:49-726(-)